MVFVLLGTWEVPFTRPLVEIEKAVKNGIITEEVIVQSGPAQYQSEYMKLVPFFSGNHLEEMYENASYIICQAGIGSIMMGLKKGKKVIATPRLKKYNEVNDDHQLEILHVFSSKNYILPWQDENLSSIITGLNSFVPSRYPFREEKISDAILNFLNKK